MAVLNVFTDASVEPVSKVGYGAYLITSELNQSLEELKQKVKVRRFENTSSTKLELEILLWALGEVEISASRIVLYTDSQNLTTLKGRRTRLEQNDYLSGKGKLLANHALYKEFFKLSDKLDFDLVKVRGHKPSSGKDETEKIFALVDRASRSALREQSR